MVTLRIPKVLAERADGQQSLELPASNSRELLVDLEEHYPELFRCLCSETGRPRKHIHFFGRDGSQLTFEYSGEDFEMDDVVLVFQAVSGG